MVSMSETDNYFMPGQKKNGENDIICTNAQQSWTRTGLQLNDPVMQYLKMQPYPEQEEWRMLKQRVEACRVGVCKSFF